jgi:hypothetical protein
MTYHFLSFFLLFSGEHPEAMQHGGQLRIGDPVNVFVFVLISLLLARR